MASSTSEIENIVSKYRFAVATCNNKKVVEKKDGTTEKKQNMRKVRKYEKKILKKTNNYKKTNFAKHTFALS